MITRLIFQLLLVSLPVTAAAFCPDGAKNDYEKAYCQIEKDHAEIALPNARDFQANDVKVQYLLLKRSAKKAGIPLKKPSSLATKPKPKPKSRLAPTPPEKTVTSASQPLEQEYLANSHRDLPTVKPPFPPLASHCSRQRTAIQCANTRYKLQSGKAIKQLGSDALSGSNQLTLPAYQGQDKWQYLRETYPVYLHKMRSLGLDSKTMTFNSFANAFDGYQQQSGGFAQRFAEMFSYLKQDRKNSPGNPGGQSPKNIAAANCYLVDSSLLVCDEGGNNYLFSL